MVAEVPSVSIYAGDTIAWPTYTFRDGTDAARNLVSEGWGQWEAQWRSKAEATNAITLIVDSSLAASGTIKITATSAQTEAMNGPGVWDLQAVKGAVVKTWVRGKTRWSKDVTRD